jgi:zinc protease
VEHLVFHDNTGGPYTDQIEAMGGECNACTSHDTTTFTNYLPKAALAATIRLEAERLGGLRFSHDSFERELLVVQNERRQVIDDDPIATVYEEMSAMLFQQHPYGRPVSGLMPDLKGMAIGDAVAFYRATSRTGRSSSAIELRASATRTTSCSAC